MALVESGVLQVVVLLGLTVWLLTLLARWLKVPAPIVLLLGGVPLAYVPWLSDVHLQPALVLFLFLPALLYYEALNTSMRELRANLRVVILSSVFLVVVTAGVVALVGHLLGLPWPMAWILGAVLAPTDATAVNAFASRLPRRALTIIRTESLINDGTALVILAVAVNVAVHHDTIGPVDVVWQFLISYVGGGVAGLVVGWLAIQARKRVRDVLMANTVSVLTPFLAFLLAEEIRGSGVVAVVVAAIFVSQAGSLVITAQDRIRARAFWAITTFLLNGTLFVLVGLSLRSAVTGLRSVSVLTAVEYTLLVCAAVILTRVAWSNITPYIIRAVDRRPQQRLRRVGFRQRQPSAWAGFRGAVSLAAALSVPASLADGSALFGRDLIIVVTFGVILLTLVLQGLTLPAVLRFARFPMDDDAAKELNQAERAAVEAALRVLPAAAERLGVTDDIEHLVRAELDERRAELFTEPAGPESGVTAGDAPVSASIPAGDPAAADPLSVPSSHDARAAPASRPDPLTAPHSANGAAAPPSDRDGAAAAHRDRDGAAAAHRDRDGAATAHRDRDGSATAHGDFDGSAETSPAAALTDAHNVPTDRSAAADGRDAGDVAVTPLADTSGLSRREQYQQLHSALVAEKRATVVRLRNNRKIDDIVLRRVEALLDAEDLRLGGSSNYLDE